MEVRAIVRDAAAVDELQRLRAQVERAEGRRMDAPVLPVPSALARLLPGGGLRPGAAYAVAPSGSLLLSLLALPSQAGSWCAAVGMPELGAEAAEQLGVDLGRLVLVPDPGPRWLAVTATLVDVLPVVVVRPAGRVSDGDAARLGARLREKDAVLLVQGVWPGVEASLGVGEVEWTGLDDGHGHLSGRAVTVTVQSRRSPVPRRARLQLDGTGRLLTAEPAVQPVPPVPIRAVS